MVFKQKIISWFLTKGTRNSGNCMLKLLIKNLKHIAKQ